jgi:glycosyltransferase involved in cell wall biosynthesis
MDSKAKSIFVERISLQRKLLEECDYATASTQYLCDYMTKTASIPAFTLRNSLNENQIRIASTLPHRNDSQSRSIGFLSGTKTHDGDFAQAAEAINKIMAKYSDVVLTVIGPLELPDSLSKFDNRIQRLAYMDYRELLPVCSRLYAVVIPLEYETHFCNAKSELKYFEQALVGVPVIASPTAPYMECIAHGVNGMLANGEKDWEDSLSRILEDAVFHDMLAKNAKEHIKDIYYPNVIGARANAIYSQIVAAQSKHGG